MEPDFSGYVTKAGLRCSDGLTIMPGAFTHQDKMRVPLVWQHGHDDAENVLGHVLLEDREDGVYGYAFFNKSAKAQHMKHAVQNKDITMMSIWANQLIKKAQHVMHGAIREVSLVLSGANPGALIQNVMSHSDDGFENMLEDEVIIYTGLELEHSGLTNETDNEEENLEHNDSQEETMTTELQHAEDDKTIAEVYESMSDEQKEVLHYMVGEALSAAEDDDEVEQSSMSSTEDNTSTNTDDQEGSDTMVHTNVFEKSKEGGADNGSTLSHDALKGLIEDARKSKSSLRDVLEAYADEHLAHGINEIDVLFPEARSIDNTPELFARRAEWVKDVMAKVKKVPFSRIKTMYADLTVAEARAKGYIKGNLKKEEFFKVAKRVTTPQTIYKKQKLDRDDILDITDFDVVAWLKGEMRIMLDEEIARAILVGDGRQVDDEDKINEDQIRPVANDHELYTTQVYVNIGDSNSSIQEFVDAVVTNRAKLRGTGLPTMYTTETYIAKFLLLKDTTNRRIYKSLDELATELRVAAIVPVEVLEEYEDIIAIFVNLADYTVGADKGGNVSMFEDFDIDYNQEKYLIETRMSGALTKLKSAMVLRRSADADVLVVPAEPTFSGTAVTIVNTTGVVYRNADTDAVINAAGSPYAVADGATMNVVAEPASGYYFSDSDVDDWSFTNEEG